MASSVGIMEYAFPSQLWERNKAAVDALVTEQLQTRLGEVDALLHEYVLTMLGNSKKISEVAKELTDFLGDDDAAQFAKDLGAKLMARYPLPTPAPVSAPDAKKAPKAKPVVKSKAVSVVAGESGAAVERSRAAATVDNVRLLNNALKQSLNTKQKPPAAPPAPRVASGLPPPEAAASVVPGFSTADLRGDTGVKGISTADLRRGQKRGFVSASAAAAEALLESHSHSAKVARTGEEEGEHASWGTAGRGGGRGGGGRFPPSSRGRGGRLAARGRAAYSWTAPAVAGVNDGEAAASSPAPAAAAGNGEGRGAEESAVGDAAPATGGRFAAYAARGGRVGGRTSRGGRTSFRGRGGPPGAVNKVWVNPDIAGAAPAVPAAAEESGSAYTWVRKSDVESGLISSR